MSSSLHIALVANTSWSIYNFRIDLIRMLVAYGCKVTVIAPWDSSTSKLIAVGVRYLPLQVDNHGMSPWHDLKLLYRFYRYYSKEDFDTIIHYTIKPNIYGSIAAGIVGTKSIAVSTGLGRVYAVEKGWVRWLLHKLLYLASRCASEMWVLNTQDHDYLIDHVGMSSNDVYILPSEGIDTSKFRPSDKIKNPHITRFLFAGRLLKAKGIVEYIALAKEMRQKRSDLRWEVMGYIDANNPDSITSDEIRYWQEQGVINYLGSVEDVRPYIDRADCVVYPSIYGEGISRILLEAASMATPIITTDHSGCREVVVDGVTGYLFAKEDSTQLVQRIQDFLLLDEDQRAAMGAQGRQYVKTHFRMEGILDRYKKKLNLTALIQEPSAQSKKYTTL